MSAEASAAAGAGAAEASAARTGAAAAPAAGPAPGYTVIDLETTGLSPAKGHRAVEIAVVQLSARGEIEDEWTTLLHPGRDLANSHVHGITAADVAGAPRFADIAPALVAAVSGRMLVAHNAPFDLRFLEAELRSAGIALERLPLRGLCTMRWSSVFLEDAASRSLADCCTATGIPLEAPHSALGDAHASAALLRHYLRVLGDAPRLPWQEDAARSLDYPWPTGLRPSTARLPERTTARAVRPDSWLEQIVSRLPRTADSRVDSYLATLEEALLDGALGDDEKDELVAVARDCGLSRRAVLDLHATYLWAIAEIAEADGVITASERADLDRIAALLGLAHVDVDQALADARAAHLAGMTPAQEALQEAGPAD